MGELGFNLFGHFVAYYGLMIVTGILVSSAFVSIQMKRFGLDMNDMVILASICGLCGMVGAKILYLIVSYKDIDFSRLRDFSYLAAVMSGGFVYLGGVVCVIPALFFCEKKLKISIQPYIQSGIGCLPIGHAFGRIGCFLVGCCYGHPYTGFPSVIYTKSLYAPNGIPLFPVQLIEALVEFLIGVCLMVFSSKLKGFTAAFLYLSAYSISRFFLEFFRYDEARGSIVGISTSQFLCIILFFSSISLFIRKI